MTKGLDAKFDVLGSRPWRGADPADLVDQLQREQARSTANRIARLPVYCWQAELNKVPEDQREWVRSSLYARKRKWRR